jgi:outer membrane protein OmpA-like peptidoglycan-associated protein
MHLGRVLIIVCGLSGAIPSAWGLTSGFEALSYRPATFGPYFTLRGARHSPAKQLTLGLQTTYAHRPLELQAAGGGRAQGVIDHQLMHHVLGHLGLLDRWLSVGVDAAVASWLKYTNPNVVGATAQSQWRVADVQLSTHTELLGLEAPIGLAFIGQLGIPTGGGQYYVGTAGISGGGTLAAETQFSERWAAVLNVGAHFQPTFNLRDMEKRHELVMGLGTRVDVTRSVRAVLELNARTRLLGPFKERVEFPIEALGGVHWQLRPAWAINAGGGAGILRGAGVPTFRAFAGVRYQTMLRRVRRLSASDRQAIESTVAYFALGSSRLSDAEAAKLSRVADILQRYPDTLLRLLGYTDPSGSTTFNQDLSERRADKVQWYFERRSGLSAAQFEAIGRGERTEDEDVPAAKQRRVDLEVAK